MSRPALKTPKLANAIREALRGLLVSSSSIQAFKVAGGFKDEHLNLFTDALTLAMRGTDWSRKRRSIFKRVDLIQTPQPLSPAEASILWKRSYRSPKEEAPTEETAPEPSIDWSGIKSGADF